MRQAIRKLVSQKFAGAGAIDYQLYGLGALLALGSSLLAGADLSNSWEVGGLILANLLSFAVILLMVMTADQLLLRRSKFTEFNLGQLMLFGLLIGFTKGVVTGAGMFWLGFDSSLEFAISSRVWQTTLLGLWFLPLLALFGTLRAQYSAQRQALINEEAAKRSGVSIQPLPLLDFVRGARERLARLGGSTDRAGLAQALRNIISDELRPLSHQLWARENHRFPSFGLLQIAKLAIRQHLYPPVILSSIWFFTTLVPTLIYFGPELGIQVQILRTLALLLVLLVLKNIQGKSFSTSLALFVGAILLIWLAQAMIGVLLSPESEIFTNPGVMVINLVWLFELILLSSMASAFLDLGRKVSVEFEELSFGGSSINPSRDFALRDRQLAQFLHGHLQSQLNAAAAKLSRQANVQSITQDLKSIERLLREALEQFGLQQAQSLEEGIEKLMQDWDGLVELSFLVPPIALSEKQIGIVCEVINEGAANALRHGFASKLSVIISEDLVVTITDNGTGPRNGAAGLGSKYFDSVSKDWELSASPAGSVLRVKIGI